MRREFTSLVDRGVFEPAILPPGRKAIGVRWCYAYKYAPDGIILTSKEKARLVALGYLQGLDDYGKTYAPVAKLVSIRTVLAYANFKGWHIYTYDVKTAFLNAPLSHVIYCKNIPGFPLPGAGPEHNSMLVKQAIYGLWQSSREFYLFL